MTNRFEALKKQYDVSEGTELNTEPEFQTKITDSNDEIIIVRTVKEKENAYSVGYTVYWADGRTSTRVPAPTFGVFESEREAILYILGFMECYQAHFTEETKKCISRGIAKYSQKSLL